MFMGGDLVIIVKVAGASYPAEALPGTYATIVGLCECRCLDRPLGPHRYWKIQLREGGMLCAVEAVLRKIDPDQHTPADFDWRELTRGPKVLS